MYIFQLRMIICYLNRQFSGLNPNSDALKLITVFLLQRDDFDMMA